MGEREYLSKKRADFQPVSLTQYLHIYEIFKFLNLPKMEYYTNMSKHISTLVRLHSSRVTFLSTTLSSSYSKQQQSNETTPKSGIDMPDIPTPPVPPIDQQPLSPPGLDNDGDDGVDVDLPPSSNSQHGAWKKRMPPDLYPPLPTGPDDQSDLPPWPNEPGGM